MKLITYTFIRLTPVLLAILSVWGLLFYFAIIEEINDETDDSLKDYSEHLIRRILVEEEVPAGDDGSNNTYILKEVTGEEAERNPGIRYSDSLVYIPQIRETEPARVLKTTFAHRNGRWYELTLMTPTIEKNDLREAVLRWTVWLCLAVSVCILFIHYLVFGRILRPLRALLKWFDRYTLGEKNELPSMPAVITEYRKLDEAARRSVARNEEMFEAQKQFIGNASHEMQTPLAVCRNRLEMLTEEGDLSDRQCKEISRVLDTLNYMVRLNRSLLLLSKIDNGQFTDIKMFDLNALIASRLPDYREIYADRRIEVAIEEQGILKCHMSEFLATVLVDNLLKNAFVHNRSDGRIGICLSSHGWTIRNMGKEEALDEQRIFDRFYQGEKKTGSTGLGLSLVSSVCRMSGIKIKYRFDGCHVFVLTFPKL